MLRVGDASNQLAEFAGIQQVFASTQLLKTALLTVFVLYLLYFVKNTIG
jgi:hypothetical protein